jgi:diguanylate cyclase (GGDEF)-like protein
MIALVAALSGGPLSPACMAFVLPIATLGARFEQRGVVIGLAFVIVLLFAVTLGVDPGAVVERPDGVFFPLGLVAAMAFLAGATTQSEREQRRDALVDPLTGLLNRAALAQRRAQLDEQAARGEEISNGLLIGGLDHFKTINDQHSHLTGDTALRDVAHVIRQTIRPLDLVYRTGGEEFVVLLPGADVATTRNIAERLRHAVAATPAAGLAVTMLRRRCQYRRLFRGALPARRRSAIRGERAGRNRVRIAAHANAAFTLEHDRDDGQLTHSRSRRSRPASDDADADMTRSDAWGPVYGIRL